MCRKYAGDIMAPEVQTNRKISIEKFNVACIFHASIIGKELPGDK
jgi:hypothetical protein